MSRPLAAPLLVSLVFLACTEAKPPPATPDPTGTCDDGALLGGPGSPTCAPGRACVLVAEGPKCVNANEADLREPCGTIHCGRGCSCAAAEQNQCLCAAIGAATTDATEDQSQPTRASPTATSSMYTSYGLVIGW